MSGNFAGFATVLPQKPMGVGSKTISAKACVNHQDTAAGAGDLQCRGHTGITTAQDDHVIMHFFLL